MDDETYPRPHVLARRWALRAARLFDGSQFHAGRPLVVIENDSIAAVDLGATPISSDLPVIDFGDATLLPGLIDTHLHLSFDREDADNERLEGLAGERDSVTFDRIRGNAAIAVRAGITTVRDLGDRNYLTLSLRDQARHDDTHLPEILTAGPPITRTQGHCWFLGGEADGIDGLRAAVAERIHRGVDVVKIMATGGMITPGWAPYQSQYTAAELAAATDHAHELGATVAVHAHGAKGITDAVAAGVDSIEHGSFLTEDGCHVDWRVVESIAEAGIFVSAMEARLPGNPAHLRELAEFLDTKSRNFARMRAMGVRLLCCSDAGVGMRWPHDVLPHGVIRFGSHLGFNNADALRIVTSTAAQACGVGDRKGHIVKGYDADILVVGGDPGVDLTAILDVRAVYRAGSRVPR